MQNILITGANGFVGKILVKKLKKKKLNIFLVLRKKKNYLNIKNNQVITCSLLDRDKIKNKLKKIKIHTVVHCAWQGVLGNQRNSRIQKQNIKIADNLINALDKKYLKKFIGLGSQAEYGLKNKTIKESDKTNPSTLYGKIKCSVRKNVNKFCSLNNIDFVWFRIFSSYGPNNDKKWLIPYLILKLIKKKKPLLTPGEQIWNFIHVDDVCEAITKGIYKKNFEGTYNLAHSKNYLIKDVIKKIYKKLNTKLVSFPKKKYRTDQVMKLMPDITLIQKKLNWRPRISLDIGLDQTIKHFKLFRN